MSVSTVDQEHTVTFDKGDALLEILTSLFGIAPSKTEEPNGYDVTFFDWDRVRLLKPGNTRAAVSASTSALGEVAISTVEGISVGSSREAALAAGAIDVGEGPDSLGINVREVPHALSLTRPGQVGLDFVRLRFTNNKVAQMQAPAFDYGDL